MRQANDKFQLHRTAAAHSICYRARQTCSLGLCLVVLIGPQAYAADISVPQLTLAWRSELGQEPNAERVCVRGGFIYIGTRRAMIVLMTAPLRRSTAQQASSLRAGRPAGLASERLATIIKSMTCS